MFDFLKKLTGLGATVADGARPATPAVFGGLRDGMKGYLGAMLLKLGLPPEAADAINAELVGLVFGLVTLGGKMLRLLAEKLAAKGGVAGTAFGLLLRFLPF